MSDASAKSKKSVVLTVSIIFNFLLLGAVAGELYERKTQQKMPERPSVSHEGKKVFKKVFSEHKGEIRKIIKDVDAKKKALYDIVVAPEFDEAAYEHAAKEFAEVTCGTAEHKLSVFKEIVKVLPQEDRQKIAKHFIESVLLGKHKKKMAHQAPDMHSKEQMSASE